MVMVQSRIHLYVAASSVHVGLIRGNGHTETSTAQMALCTQACDMPHVCGHRPGSPYLELTGLRPCCGH